MAPKIIYLYLIAATLALALVIYQLITGYPNYNTARIVLNGVMSLCFYYLAYKTYHTHKDKELM